MTIPGKKLLLWSLSLVLILSCAPAAITPAPTLDPNSINLLIAQTANAAFTQTAVAIPVFVSTPTVISIPTFTPESTFTPVPLIVLSSPTTLPRTQYFRVKHDSQLALYNFQSRTAAADWGHPGEQTPEVVPLFVDPKVASGTNRTTVDGNWEIYINALNHNNARKLRFLKAPDTALFNGAGFPQLESLTMGGPSTFNIGALEDTEVIQIEWEKFNEMFDKIPKFERMFRLMLTRAFVAHQQRIIDNLCMPARDRYRTFLKRYRHIEQRLPQNQIASYLGMTPEFLSQIRKKITDED